MALRLRRIPVHIPGEKGERLKQQTEMVCIWCGTAFWTFRNDAKTCSGSCRVQMCIDNKKKRL